VFSRFLAAVMAVLCLCGAAQAVGTHFPDSIRAPATEPEFDWVTLLYILVGLAAVLVASFKNARRTHLD
jgi:hypothetical protein